MRVLVVAEQPSLADEVLGALRPDPRITLLAAVLGRDGALAELRDRWPNVVVIVEPLAGDDALDLARLVKSLDSTIRVALLSQRVTAELLLAAVAAELDEVIRIATPAEELVDRIAASGRMAVIAGLQRQGAAIEQALDRLPIETAALLLAMAGGATLAQAAGALQFSSSRAERMIDPAMRVLAPSLDGA
jgi:DNA-binding NarL/FixJ family response regulator